MEDGSWITWELGARLRIDHIEYEVIKLFHEEEEPKGVFRSCGSKNIRIERSLPKMVPPPLKTTPVYNVYVILNHDDLRGKVWGVGAR